MVHHYSRSLLSDRTLYCRSVTTFSTIVITILYCCYYDSIIITGTQQYNKCNAFIVVSSSKRRPTLFSISSSIVTKLKLQQQQTSNTYIDDTTFTQPNVIQAGIAEELCIDTANRMKRVLVPVSKSIHPNEQVGISYSYWPAASSSNSNKRKQQPAVVLVHGFDSSNLEFRRLGSKLASRGIDTYAVDLLGWGYTQLQDVLSFSAQAKVEALNSFVQTIVVNNNNNNNNNKQQQQRNFCIAGASLGGAASIEVSTINNNCIGLILIDAQGFVDGIGPMSKLPTPIAKVGVQVLKSIPLRSSANQMSYYNKKVYATDEAVTIGRLHCIEQGTGWSNALVSFMQSGGFTPSKFVSTISVPTLLLWGRQDTILDGTEFIPKFLNTIPSTIPTTLRWIEQCGHVPHLEQPDETADAISNFLTTLSASSSSTMTTTKESSPTIDSTTAATAIGVASIAAIAGAYVADWIPTM